MFLAYIHTYIHRYFIDYFTIWCTDHKNGSCEQSKHTQACSSARVTPSVHNTSLNRLAYGVIQYSIFLCHRRQSVFESLCNNCLMPPSSPHPGIDPMVQFAPIINFSSNQSKPSRLLYIDIKTYMHAWPCSKCIHQVLTLLPGCYFEMMLMINIIVKNS